MHTQDNGVFSSILGTDIAIAVILAFIFSLGTLFPVLAIGILGLALLVKAGALKCPAPSALTTLIFFAGIVAFILTFTLFHLSTIGKGLGIALVAVLAGLLVKYGIDKIYGLQENKLEDKLCSNQSDNTELVAIKKNR